MDNIDFSNDLFRKMVQAFKPQSINEVEDVQEAVPFKKHAFGEMKLLANKFKKNLKPGGWIDSWCSEEENYELK